MMFLFHWEHSMKTAVLYHLLSVGALFLFLAGQAAADEHPVLGQGNISCSSWLEGRQSDNAGSSRTAWVLGFMTASINTDQSPRPTTCPREKALKN